MLTIDTDQADFEREDVLRCAEVLKRGGIGVVPTDTVYGIAARADDEQAVSRVLRIKHRAPDKPLPVQIASSWDANLLGVADGPAASALIGRFWPGALTIVMEYRAGTYLPFQRDDTIGLRVPASPFCVELISEAGWLVVPSANGQGQAPPTRPEQVTREVLDAVDFFVRAGECPVGIESTVVDVTHGIDVLREGAIALGDILEAIGGIP